MFLLCFRAFSRRLEARFTRSESRLVPPDYQLHFRMANFTRTRPFGPGVVSNLAYMCLGFTLREVESPVDSTRSR